MYALLNVVKTMVMSLIMIIGSHVITKEDFRMYFIGALLMNVGFQCIVATTFRFKDTLSNRRQENNNLFNDDIPSPSENEMGLLKH